MIADNCFLSPENERATNDAPSSMARAQVSIGGRSFTTPVFNVDPMVHALVTQARLNAQQAAFDHETARRLAAGEERDARNRQAVRNLTAEMDRLAADLKSHRALVASVVERLDALDRDRAGGPAAKGRGGGTDGRADGGAAPDSVPAAGTPPNADQAAGRAAGDAPDSPPAAATPPPNR